MRTKLRTLLKRRPKLQRIGTVQGIVLSQPDTETHCGLCGHRRVEHRRSHRRVRRCMHTDCACERNASWGTEPKRRKTGHW